MHDNDTPLMEVNRSLGRLEGKVDALLRDGKADREANVALAARVSKLEAWRNYLAGAWFVLTIVAGAVIKLVVK